MLKVVLFREVFSLFITTSVIALMPAVSIAMEDTTINPEGTKPETELTMEQKQMCWAHRSKEGQDNCVQEKIQENIAAKEKKKADDAIAEKINASVPDPTNSILNTPPSIPKCPITWHTSSMKQAAGAVVVKYKNAENETDPETAKAMKESASQECHGVFSSAIAQLKNDTECKDDKKAQSQAKYYSSIKDMRCTTPGTKSRKQTEADIAEAAAIANGETVAGAQTNSHLYGYVNETCASQSGGVQVCTASTGIGNMTYYKDGTGAIYNSYEAATADQVVAPSSPAAAPRRAEDTAAKPAPGAAAGAGSPVAETPAKTNGTTNTEQPAATATNTPPQSQPATTPGTTSGPIPGTTTPSLQATANPYGNSFLSSTPTQQAAVTKNSGSSFESPSEVTSGSANFAALGGANYNGSGGNDSVSSGGMGGGYDGSSGRGSSFRGGGNGSSLGSGFSAAGGTAATASLPRDKAISSKSSPESLQSASFNTGLHKAPGKDALSKSSLGANNKKNPLLKNGSKKRITASSTGGCRDGDLQCLANFFAKERKVRPGRGGRGLASIESMRKNPEIGSGSKDILSSMANIYDKMRMDEDGNLEN